MDEAIRSLVTSWHNAAQKPNAQCSVDFTLSKGGVFLESEPGCRPCIYMPVCVYTCMCPDRVSLSLNLTLATQVGLGWPLQSSGRSDSGAHICTVVTLLTEPSPYSPESAIVLKTTVYAFLYIGWCPWTVPCHLDISRSYLREGASVKKMTRQGATHR